MIKNKVTQLMPIRQGKGSGSGWRREWWGWVWVKRSEPKPHVTTTEFASQQDHFLGFTVGVVEFSRLAQGMSISVHATSVAAYIYNRFYATC